NLVSLHLMVSEEIDNLISCFEGKGSNVVKTIPAKSKPLPATEDGMGLIKINKTQSFTKIPPEVWKFNIGGYQVCYKWLKDRKGRTLADKDILHYQRIITVIMHTISIMDEIDKIITEKSDWPLR
ncbi:MAG: type ISP restriction/modification enzyme, partial [Candidatus Hodarchaeota archaeon]